MQSNESNQQQYTQIYIEIKNIYNQSGQLLLDSFPSGMINSSNDLSCFFIYIYILHMKVYDIYLFMGVYVM